MARERPPSEGQPGTSQPMADATGIDLGALRDMHPRLPPDMGAMMVLRAALGLQRNNHSPGAELQMAIESARLRCVLTWPAADLGTLEQHDSKHITEDGAEAIALAVARRTKNWQVLRRMQQGEHADWLLERRDNAGRKLVAFEVGGTDTESIARPLRDKLAQVAKAVGFDQRCAGVVGFKQPQAVLRSVAEGPHDR